MSNEEIPIEIAWKTWTECLIGNDINSIFQQISTLIWDTAIFRIIIESRQIQIESNQENPKINGAFHSFIDRNYFQSQAICIRRLLDNSYPLTKKKAVYSLYSVIKDLRKFREELNREKFFALRKMPYQYSEIKEKENTFYNQQAIGEGFFVPPELDWESIEEVHQIFDRLSGKTPETRLPDDLINDTVFSKLIEKLDEGKVISSYVDKFVAHSAAPESRVDINDNNFIVTFEQLWKVHRNIYEVGNFLLLIFFSTEQVALVWENPSFFKFWDVPLYELKQSNRLISTFDSYKKETESWRLHGNELIWRLIEQ